MAGAYGGFTDLGSILAGAGADRRGSFIKGAQQGATLETALANAKIKRDQAMQRDSLRDTIAAAMPGTSPEQVDLIAALTAGSESLGSGFSAAQQGIGRMHGNEGITSAQALPLPGAAGYGENTPDMLNQLLAASGANGPLTPSNVQVMPQARSKMGADTARADASSASADRQRSAAKDTTRKVSAQVDTERARKDNVGKPKAGAKPAKSAGRGALPDQPTKGEVYDGYRFKGGNPADKASWEKA